MGPFATDSALSAPARGKAAFRKRFRCSRCHHGPVRVRGAMCAGCRSFLDLEPEPDWLEGNYPKSAAGLKGVVILLALCLGGGG
jgi:hypothetical protein